MSTDAVRGHPRQAPPWTPSARLGTTQKIVAQQVTAAIHPRPGHRRALLKIYAHCIDGQADASNQRITDALGAKDAKGEPGGEEDGDIEQAS
jgi:hypothetical protein